MSEIPKVDEGNPQINPESPNILQLGEPKDKAEAEKKFRHFFATDESSPNEISIEPKGDSTFEVNSLIADGIPQADKPFSLQFECDFKFQDNGYGTYYQLIFHNLSLLIDGRNINLKELLPPKTEFVMEPMAAEAYNLRNKTISMEHLSTIEDFAVLFHEIGHSIDWAKRGISDDQEREKTISERNAWAEALKIVKKYNIPMKQITKEKAEECLKTYDAGDVAVSNTNRIKKRKNIK